MHTPHRLGLVLLMIAMVAPVARSGEPVGWRTDGTGRYPDATPPTSWSATENVLWQTPLPSWGNASPVVVAGRIFVTAEPTTLICADAKTGAILWQHTNTYLDALSPAEAARVSKLMEETDAVATQKRLQRAQGNLSRARNQLKKKPDDATLKDQVAKLGPEIKQLSQRLEAVKDYLLPKSHGVNGYASPTPVSDGEHVWVLFGTGTAACYDMAGHRKWIRTIERPTHVYGHSTSPILVGGKLIIHILDLVALDPQTGEELWRTKAPIAFGTPVAATIGGEPVVVSQTGGIFRAADGQKLADCRVKLTYNQPIVDGRTVYFIQSGGKAIRLPETTDGKIEQLWVTRPKKDRYYASPVLYEGLIYDITQTGVLSAIDAASGEVVYEQKLDLGKQQVYPSLCLAGKYIVASANGQTVLFEPGRTYREVARNQMESFRTTPVFLGRRMIVRTMKHLVCVGR